MVDPVLDCDRSVQAAPRRRPGPWREKSEEEPGLVPRELFLTGVWFGLLTGLLELGVVLLQRAFVLRITMDSLRTNRHYLWMIPVADLLVFGACGFLLVGLDRIWPRLAQRAHGYLYVGLLALALLLNVEGLYALACVVLACGIASRAGSLTVSRRTALRRLVRISLPVMIGGLVALTAVSSFLVVSAERRALAKLPAPSKTPNVLFIVLDNVRAESMSLYGRVQATTPNLEQLARRGVRFDQARATAPWTLPSHASMFTGQWSSHLSVDFDRGLPKTYPTLAEYLASHGYAAAGFIGNTYYCNARYGLDRGFARYEDYYENQTISLFEIVRSTKLGKRLLALSGSTMQVRMGDKDCRKTASMINRDALQWLSDRPRDRPFFMFLNYFDAHSPFIPPDGARTRFGLCGLPEVERIEGLKRYQRLLNHKLTASDGDPKDIERTATTIFLDCYESCIASLDEQIGQLFQELERRRLADNTVVIVTSDHGEHFREHGFFGHGMSLYRSELHVPLLILAPQGDHAGLAVAEPVSLRDLPATVVDLVGLGDRSPFPGRSLARTLGAKSTEARSPSVPLLSEVGQQKSLPPMREVPSSLGPLKSIVSDGKVYIRNGDGREELYDLLGDPHEARNLASKTDLNPSLPHFRELLEQLLTAPPPTLQHNAESTSGHSSAQWQRPWSDRRRTRPRP